MAVTGMSHHVIVASLDEAYLTEDESSDEGGGQGEGDVGEDSDEEYEILEIKKSKGKDKVWRPIPWIPALAY